MAADEHGNPLDFTVAGGEVHDAKAAPELINKIRLAEMHSLIKATVQRLFVSR